MSTKPLEFLGPLRRYRHTAPAEEVPVVTRMIDFIQREPDAAFSRECREGHFTSSAVIVRRDGMLLNFHAKLQRWLQLGGHVEAGEGPEEAALREGIEESEYGELQFLTGPRQPSIVDLDIHEIPANPREAAHLHYDVRYLLRMRDPLTPLAVSNLKWFTWKELRELEEESLRRLAQKSETIIKNLGSEFLD